MYRRMPGYFIVAVLLVLSLVAPLGAQKSGPPSKTPSQPTSASGGSASSAPTSTFPSVPAFRNPPFVYGKILTESGASLPESTSVELNCESQLVRAIHPQLNGTFQFDLRAVLQSNPDMSAAVEHQDISLTSSQKTPDCDLRVSAPGYQPVFKIIEMHDGDVRGVNVGDVLLTPMLIDSESSVTVTSLLVPKKARKEFEKGENDLRHNNLPSAALHLEKAVAEYDQFAAAWNVLGRIYVTERQNDRATEAFSKAIAADPHYIPPYISLADLQLQESQFENAAATAGRALAVSPGLAPAGYIQAVADFKLNRLDAAEQSARAAERGPHQNIPQLHLLLAEILLRKNDYSGAAEEMRSYLKEFPNGKFVSEVKSRLPDVEKAAADDRGGTGTAEKQPNPAPASAAGSQPTAATAR